ncbi:MAG: ribonuclease J [Oscillospiraceae bacterium]|nr:ribonuclease J [Oscillospiraceae bacterium]
MAEKLKIISLGGLNEIGKNLTAYEYGGEILLVDCGMGFPDDDMYGVDMVIPDFTYLVKNKEKIVGLLVTHGHEDHIGGIPYLLREMRIPVFATRLTAGLIHLKLEEFGIADKAELYTVDAGDSFKLGCFKIEFIHVNHSIPDAVAMAIKTPVGMVIHTGDFKIDTTPIEGGMIDLTRFGELGKKGVLALLMDSTNVERQGHTISERKVGQNIEALFKDCDKRIVVTTFASNVHRVQQVINCAVKYGRKVAVTGRSMEKTMSLAADLGYMEIPEGTLVDLNQIKNLPKDKIVIISTGSQGEPMSALYRMAISGHRQVEIGAGDRVIISASAIPGNEKTVSHVVNELFRKGADVIYDRSSDLHVTGHACQDELKLIMGLVKPRFFVPLHGEYRHLCLHKRVAEEMGIPAKNCIISDIGKVIEVSPKSIKLNGSVPAGRVFVEGTSVGDVGTVVLRDRKHLAQDGMLMVVMTLSGEDNSIVSGPDIITRGFIYVKESEKQLAELKTVTLEALEDCERQGIRDTANIKSVVKQRLSDYLYKATKRNPMILPVIMEV